MSKSTVVNTIPWELEENKPGNFPSVYRVPAAPKGDISVLVVEDGHHNVIIPLSDEKAPPLRKINTSEMLAESIINDFVNASVFTSKVVKDDGSVAIPGLFWVEGALTVPLVKAKYADKVKQALANTRAWFLNVITVADDAWEKYRQRLMITDVQRRAARYLDYEREWSTDFLAKVQEELINCWACQTAVSPKAILCYNCKNVVNKELYEKNKELFALASKVG